MRAEITLKFRCTKGLRKIESERQIQIDLLHYGTGVLHLN
nr:MAG TPA: hypothetical protein [Caudoviricetes sp.]